MVVGGLVEALGQRSGDELQALRDELGHVRPQPLEDRRRELRELESPSGRADVDDQRPVTLEPRGLRVLRDPLADRGRPGAQELGHPRLRPVFPQLTLHLFADPLHAMQPSRRSSR
jgi:hypothetical protein